MRQHDDPHEERVSLAMIESKPSVLSLAWSDERPVSRRFNDLHGLPTESAGPTLLIDETGARDHEVKHRGRR